jgi:predicted aldo/keto reductase-like oxidoreductase
MQKKPFGNTGMMVSELGFGGIPIMRLEHDEAIEVIRYAYSLGVNFYDTANMYTGSESLMGEALEGVRNQVYFATKTAARDAKTAQEHLDLSLKQLRTDYIDLYQMHNVSTPENLEKALASDGVMAVAQKAKEAGQIKHIGITCHNLEIATQACETGLFASIQVPFSLVEHDPLQKLLPTAQKLGMGILAMKPFGGGLMNRAELCIGFLQQYPYVLPIPGIQAKEEIKQNADLYENPQGLSEQDWKDIEDIRRTLGTRFCHRCEYCQPCPQEIRIPMALLYKAVVQRSAPARIMTFCKTHLDKIEDCIQCGECEEKCPYNLPIIDMLQEVYADYQNFKEAHPELQEC